MRKTVFKSCLYLYKYAIVICLYLCKYLYNYAYSIT